MERDRVYQGSGVKQTPLPFGKSCLAVVVLDVVSSQLDNREREIHQKCPNNWMEV